MGEEVQIDLNKFDIDAVSIDVKISVMDKAEGRLELIYSGKGGTLDDVIDGCHSAVANLVGFLEARQPV